MRASCILYNSAPLSFILQTFLAIHICFHQTYDLPVVNKILMCLISHESSRLTRIGNISTGATFTREEGTFASRCWDEGAEEYFGSSVHGVSLRWVVE